MPRSASHSRGYRSEGVEIAILLALAQHASLAAEQIAAHLRDPVDDVQLALRRLRDRGLVDVLAVGELQAHSTNAAAYWRLTEDGRRELRRHLGRG